MPAPGNDSRCALHELTRRPATWFEHVEDTELVAFEQPLLTALAQSVAVGELIGGTLVVILPPDDEGVARFTPEEPVNAFAVD